MKYICFANLSFHCADYAVVRERDPRDRGVRAQLPPLHGCQAGFRLQLPIRYRHALRSLVCCKAALETFMSVIYSRSDWRRQFDRMGCCAAAVDHVGSEQTKGPQEGLLHSQVSIMSRHTDCHY